MAPDIVGTAPAKIFSTGQICKQPFCDGFKEIVYSTIESSAGIKVGRRHVGTLMKRMGIEALYRKPGTRNKHPGHKVFPYLLRGVTINRSY